MCMPDFPRTHVKLLTSCDQCTSKKIKNCSNMACQHHNQFSNFFNFNYPLLFFHFHHYILNKPQQFHLGFPIQDINNPGFAFIYKSHPPIRHNSSPAPQNKQKSEFVPRSEKCSSFPESLLLPSSQSVTHSCVRCSKKFQIDCKTGEYLTTEMCQYHWGKRSYIANSAILWTCCGGSGGSPGCAGGSLHVWSGLTPGQNTRLPGYVQTRPGRFIPFNGDYGIYALDCEMCFTKSGLELVRVTVVNLRKEIVYDTLVNPDGEVIDYNTRFSGITGEMMAGVRKSLRDVQRDLMSFISAESIIIGHGLENDLKALKLLHSKIVDTAVVFSKGGGCQFRKSLKQLAREVLNREIQAGEHDSAEDARTVVDLMMEIVETEWGGICGVM